MFGIAWICLTFKGPNPPTENTFWNPFGHSAKVEVLKWQSWAASWNWHLQIDAINLSILLLKSLIWRQRQQQQQQQQQWWEQNHHPFRHTTPMPHPQKIGSPHLLSPSFSNASCIGRHTRSTSKPHPSCGKITSCNASRCTTTLQGNNVGWKGRPWKGRQHGSFLNQAGEGTAVKVVESYHFPLGLVKGCLFFVIQIEQCMEMNGNETNFGNGLTHSWDPS